MTRSQFVLLCLKTLASRGRLVPNLVSLTRLFRPLVVTMTFLTIFLCGCASPRPDSASKEIPSAKGSVRVYGELRAMFHRGQTLEIVNLSALLPNDNVYAVGAIAGLGGEITVLRGTAYLSYPDIPEGVRTESVASTTEGATLLVAAEVKG